ncbi:Melibiase subfamily [Congregicoccus parvus]|uniref:Melibiase subfamily n=1 Tax=Congregicoccus parvus TaxID=3081749 RepID=UPI003FA57C44
MKSEFLFALSCTAAAVPALASDAPAFLSWAPTPPMGWNSWDNFATTITEAQTKAQADFMATRLKEFGWQYIVVDIQWYEPGATSHAYRQDAVLTMDEFGRLLPAPNRFPSSVDGAGFRPLADYVHGLGLKFGVHLMRGIPRQAVKANTPVFGTDVGAQDIANVNSICPWNPDMYGVDMSKPGAQAYYDSVFALFASWGVDYVKVDDIARPYHDHEKEIEAIRTAIDRTGRPMVLSLSPGETALTAAAHVQRHANLWRISDDFWDTWPVLHEQFARLENWNPHRRAGAWPDADMLPFGVIDLGKRTSRFTPAEHYTVMSLWSIARSPLMHGGDMTQTDDFTLSLLTNPEVIAVNQHSENNRPLFNRADHIAWVADAPGTSDKYLALFNARDQISQDPAGAAYRSEVLSPRGALSTGEIEVDVAGTVKVVLVLDDAGDGTHSDRGVWVRPRWVDAAGKETPVVDGAWVSACGGWGSVDAFTGERGPSVNVDGARVAYGIAAHAKSIVEYDVPRGAAKLRFAGAVDDGVRRSRDGATMRFLVFTAKPGGNLDLPGLPVEVDLASVGFPSGAHVRDLWKREDLGRVDGVFAPVIHWHGAGLFRISPIAAGDDR